MAELMVVGFQGKHRAAEVLEQLGALSASWTLDLKDAVAVYRTKTGKLRIDGSVQPTSKEGAAAGALTGGLLGGLLMAVLITPLTAGASAAAVAAAIGSGALSLGLGGAVIGADEAAEWKRTYGISEEFVQQVGGMVQTGQSAVFALAQTSDLEALEEKFRGYGGTILRTTLPPEAAAKFQELMTSKTAAAR
jgi:uncharacterized membrane protein